MIDKQDRELMRRLAGHILEILETDATLSRDEPKDAIIKTGTIGCAKDQETDYCPNCGAWINSGGIGKSPNIKYCVECGQKLNEFSLVAVHKQYADLHDWMRRLD